MSRPLRIALVAIVAIALVLWVVVPVSAGSLISLNATMSGAILSVSANSTFAQLVNTAGAGPGTGSAIIAPNIQTLSSTGANLFDRMNDGLLVFPNKTSKWGIPPNATIERATVYLSKSGSSSDLGHFSIVLTNGTATNLSVVSTADYLKKGNLSLSLPVLDTVAGANTSFVLNSYGVSYVNKSGSTVFHIQSTDMVNLSFSGTWASGGKFSQLQWYMWNDANTGRLPRIDVYYSYPPIGTSPMPKVPNANTPLDISTYDGSDQLTHPCVIYSETGWNGYHYLMAETPYPNQTSSLENPSMRYSNDKTTWTTIAGQPDPIISPSALGWFSDPNIYLDGNTLYLFYRFGWFAGASGSYYNVTSTTDGVTWTEPVMVNGMNSTLSASFVKNRDDQWEAWAGDGLNPYIISHYISESPYGPYTSLGKISGITTDAPDSYWHHEFKIYDGQYQSLILPKVGWYGLYFFNSTNGDNWTPSEYNPILSQNIGAWDTDLYKSSFVGYGNGSYDIWYSGWEHNATYSTWKVGYTTTFINPPLAMFTPAGPQSIRYPQGIYFQDVSTNTPTAWDWSWGDGTHCTTQNCYKVWYGPGTYNVSLTATNAAGSSTNYTTVSVLRWWS